MTTADPVTTDQVISTEHDRVAQFERDIADLKLKTSGGWVERVGGIVGLLMMATGIGIAIGASLKAGTKQDPRDLDELIILNLAMIAVVVAGAALFLWRVLLQFWRFWMLRQTFELQRHIDQVGASTRVAPHDDRGGDRGGGRESQAQENR
jgi:hypothetical protein